MVHVQPALRGGDRHTQVRARIQRNTDNRDSRCASCGAICHAGAQRARSRRGPGTRFRVFSMRVIGWGARFKLGPLEARSASRTASVPAMMALKRDDCKRGARPNADDSERRSSADGTASSRPWVRAWGRACGYPAVFTLGEECAARAGARCLRVAVAGAAGRSVARVIRDIIRGKSRARRFASIGWWQRTFAFKGERDQSPSPRLVGSATPKRAADIFERAHAGADGGVTAVVAWVVDDPPGREGSPPDRARRSGRATGPRERTRARAPGCGRGRRKRKRRERHDERTTTRLVRAPPARDVSRSRGARWADPLWRGGRGDVSPVAKDVVSNENGARERGRTASGGQRIRPAYRTPSRGASIPAAVNRDHDASRIPR